MKAKAGGNMQPSGLFVKAKPKVKPKMKPKAKVKAKAKARMVCQSLPKPLGNELLWHVSRPSARRTELHPRDRSARKTLTSITVAKSSTERNLERLWNMVLPLDTGNIQPRRWFATSI